MYETGLSLQAVQRELDNLVDLGILKKRETYNRVFYEVDTDSIFFKPLMQIYLSFGVVSTLLTVRSKLRKGDGSIFRDKGEKKTSYFWLKNLSDGLNLLTSFLSQSSKRIE